jgi:hypothetical protein
MKNAAAALRRKHSCSCESRLNSESWIGTDVKHLWLFLCRQSFMLRLIWKYVGTYSWSWKLSKVTFFAAALSA